MAPQQQRQREAPGVIPPQHEWRQELRHLQVGANVLLVSRSSLRPRPSLSPRDTTISCTHTHAHTQGLLSDPTKPLVAAFVLAQCYTLNSPATRARFRCLSAADMSGLLTE
jgi:hypothetical protein